MTHALGVHLDGDTCASVMFPLPHPEPTHHNYGIAFADATRDVGGEGTPREHCHVGSVEVDESPG